MTAGRIAVRDSKVVVVADVALDTISGCTCWRHLMVAGQSPTGGTMIPSRCSEQSGCRMTIRTIRGGKSWASGRVHRNCRGRPIVEVATGIRAIRGGNLQTVIAIDMALCTSQRRTRVLARQCETRGAVIKRRGCPTRSVVAGGALGDWEAGGNVIRDVAAQRRGAIPVLQVAGGIAAVGGSNHQGVVVADVAGDAGCRCRRYVHAGERKAGYGVIKGSQIRPGNGVVAL